MAFVTVITLVGGLQLGNLGEILKIEKKKSEVILGAISNRGKLLETSQGITPDVVSRNFKNF